MKKYAIIVAGGEGNRAGGIVPKQFQLVGGIPMLWWSVRAFYKEDSETNIILVLHPGFFDEWDSLYRELPEMDKHIRYKIVCGGKNRLESVRNGLNSVGCGEDVFVAIHDAARPLVTNDIIRRGWEAVSLYKAVVPVVAETDSLREIKGEDSFVVNRNDYRRVQTPQVFNSQVIKDAYKSLMSDFLTDDASVVEASGKKVYLYEGESVNFKVTNPEDIKIADLLLS